MGFQPDIKKFLIIISWAAFTFASHYYAKIFLAGSSNFLVDVITLTSVQMLVASQLIMMGNKEVKNIQIKNWVNLCLLEIIL